MPPILGLIPRSLKPALIQTLGGLSGHIHEQPRWVPTLFTSLSAAEVSEQAKNRPMAMAGLAGCVWTCAGNTNLVQPLGWPVWHMEWPRAPAGPGDAAVRSKGCAAPACGLGRRGQDVPLDKLRPSLLHSSWISSLSIWRVGPALGLSSEPGVCMGPALSQAALRPENNTTPLPCTSPAWSCNQGGQPACTPPPAPCHGGLYMVGLHGCSSDTRPATQPSACNVRPGMEGNSCMKFHTFLDVTSTWCSLTKVLNWGQYCKTNSSALPPSPSS